MSETLPATNTIKTIRELLLKSKDQIALALPRHLNADRLLRVAMTTIQRTPKLLDCTPKSLLGAVMECAQLGLEPDGILGHAYLIPFKVKGVYQAQLMIGYKGLISLARRSGQVISISAQVVYERDKFEYQYGLEEKLNHIPAAGDRGKPIYVYAVAKMRDGGHAFEVLTVNEVEKIRKSSKAADDGPWVTHWEEMARKTAVRRLAKYLPLSVEFQRAATLDEYVEAGIIQDLGEQKIIDLEQKTEEKKEELKKKIKMARTKAEIEEKPKQENGDKVLCSDKNIQVDMG